ncbi:BamA/TamA family outer membrane protein [Sphingomonas sp. BGYR3]|uniref:autotransporter assembly complex protein TamA n=1 Tax=Sphingomonas sp. BGYR3 TaxID=2975483 RepID=UPI0021A491C7|nr:BamA/TamA family outer membrane protein [Sphingomonas sp. BGYR3]MDG5488170.1 BamA/TamA family outer membrane protein [Sphingomonas sp. BGYR3]
MLPWAAHAQESGSTAPAQTVPTPAPAPAPTPEPSPDSDTDTPIVPDKEFEDALPALSNDPNAPLEPMSAFEGKPADQAKPKEQGQQEQGQPAPPANPASPATSGDIAAPAPLPAEPVLAEPLPPLDGFDVTPPVEVAAETDPRTVEIRYTTVVEGLDTLGLKDLFNDLSALREGDGKAANATMVAARAREDEQLAVRLMRSRGYYDGTAISTVEQNPANSGRLRATVSATPGKQYRLDAIAVRAEPTVPPGLVESVLPLKSGDPIEADRVQGAEANVALQLPRQGYPFVQVGQRDIVLDERDFTGDYTLPVDTGPRSSFGGLKTEGELAFDVDHLAVFPRFKAGELYDVRRVDDLRDALIATGLFSTVSVEPQRTGTPGPDGTEQVDLLVRQNAGPARTLAAEGGYGTGQGIRVEGTWTHRNLFPPEGALIVSAVAGTQEQGAGVTFRRSNAGKRDRTFSLAAIANRSNYDAFEAFTGTLSARISYDSTPIWQKRWTYYFGAELVGTNEDVFSFDRNERIRRTYGIAALPLFLGYDASDDLLNPTRGFRVKLNLSPEASVQGSTRPYLRSMVEVTGYYPITDDLVIAGRARAGSIAGISRDNLAPSRRYYAGGGGSVRGFGFQELGPRTIEPNPDFDPTNPNEKDPPTIFRPLGGRSLNEFALEARYRFGNFGIVPFVDAGQVYDSTLPRGSDLRFGAGIGGRFYTNFGPMRVDIATPINRQPGESRIALYISIGQAF